MKPRLCLFVCLFVCLFQLLSNTLSLIYEVWPIDYV
jgi:hypothetical protein